MSIDFQHPLFKKNTDKWQLVDDICDAQNLDDHIVKLNPTDNSTAAKERRDQFFKRSVFYAVAGYTSRGLVGKAFQKAPKCEVPPELEYVKTNIDGAGQNIYQQSQEVFRDVIRNGRAGLLIDFPETDGEISRADLISGKVFATITRYKAQQITNWQVEQRGPQVIPVKIVLKTTANEMHEDGFGFDVIDEYICLHLEEGVYMQQIYRRNQRQEWYVYKESVPRDSAGNTLDFIPFVFVGSEANTFEVDHPPLYDLAKINVGHYNNSAIYEDSVFTVGQVQPYMSGLNQETVDLMKAENMYVGSGRLLGVPSGETFGFAQAQPNSLAKEAMKDKVSMMIAMGANLMEMGTANKTAMQVGNEMATQHSVLSLIAYNLSLAYTKALEIATKFMGGDPDAAEFEVNNQFVQPKTDAQMLNAVVASFLQGVLPISDLFDWQKKHGLISPDKTFEEYSEEVGIDDMADLDADDTA